MRKRSYRQYCGLAKALDVIGQRWTLLIVRNLFLGPLRYTEFLNTLPGITTNLLADRLREMEEDGLLVKCAVREPSEHEVVIDVPTAPFAIIAIPATDAEISFDLVTVNDK